MAGASIIPVDGGYLDSSQDVVPGFGDATTDPVYDGVEDTFGFEEEPRPPGGYLYVDSAGRPPPSAATTRDLLRRQKSEDPYMALHEEAHEQETTM